MKNKNPLISQIIAIGVLVVVLILLIVLKTNQAVCEFMATTFSRGWIWLFGNILGWIPISFYELFLICAIVGLIISLVILIKRLCKKNYKQALSLFLALVIVALGGINVYTATASFSYNRAPLPDYVSQAYSGEDLTFEQAVEIAECIVQEVNITYNQTERDKDGNILLPSFDELNRLIAEEYKKLDGDYFSSYTPKVKRIFNERIMSELHLSGVTFCPFGEPNINGMRMDLFTPSTMAHELAHIKGVMRESDADVVSSYVLLTSNNPYLRYSALMECMYEALSIVEMYPNSKSEYDRLYGMIEEGVFEERRAYTKHWWSFTLFADIGEFFNDIYLKLQGQTGGTDSYFEPSFSVGTGELDADGNEIVQIISFSNMQNLLITLYKQGKIPFSK